MPSFTVRIATGLAAAACLCACAATEALRVPVPALSCQQGRYAVVLPQHAPTLRVIGRHRVTELGQRDAGGDTVTRRRIDYMGLRLEIEQQASRPQAYRLLALDAISRRWHVGALSVGRRPWRWFWEAEPALEGVRLDGPVELVGPVDSVLLTLRDGRVDEVHYRCRPEG